MATLGKDMPFPAVIYGAADIQAELGKEAAALAAIEAKLPVLRFQRGDGYALYAVASERPLVLRWIPYGDAWQIAAHEVRGLRLADVRAILESQKALARMFGTRKGLPS